MLVMLVRCFFQCNIRQINELIYIFTRMRKREGARDAKSSKFIVKKFSSASSWTELISHYQGEHPKTSRDLERMTPSQVAEMKQRMVAGDRSMHRG